MERGKTVKLPERDEMFRRLSAVSDVSHVRERFFPLLINSAGSELVGQGVVMMLTLAIHDYTEGMPPMMAGLMFMDAPRYIDALVDDDSVAKEAKSFLREVLEKE